MVFLEHRKLQKACVWLSCCLLLLTFASYTAGTKILSSVIRGTEGNENIFGLARVLETDNGTVTVEASVWGLPAGNHGFHVHVYGDTVGEVDGTAAGGHYNPNNANHAGPGAPERHVGDLGNILSDGGGGMVAATYSRAFLPGDSSRPTVVSDFANSIIGRSFVVHADPDDLTSQPTGNAGARLAVGVIGIGNHELYGGGDDAEEVTEHITAKGNDGSSDGDEFEEPQTLVCQIHGDGIGGFGKVNMHNGVAELSASVSGLSPGQHGFHIHWFGEEYEYTTNNLTSVTRDLARAGGHYNPTGDMHGLPPATPRHYGDGGNIQVGSNGTGTVVVALEQVSHLRHLVGRTCLVHADPDNGEDPAGNAGARIAAGQLGYANPTTDQNFQVPGETPEEVEDNNDTSGGRVVQMIAKSNIIIVSSVLLFSIYI